MRRAHLTLLLLAAVSMPAWSTTVYKWVDDAGIVHFSDTPRPGAVALEVGSPQTYAAPAGTPAPGAPSAAAHVSTPATTCSIDSPANDQVFSDVDSVSGHATISPGLKPGETATLVLDGAAQSIGADGGFQMPVERGSHTVAVMVTDDDGETLCQATVTFHVRQQSRIAPTTPTAPGVQNHNRPQF